MTSLLADVAAGTGRLRSLGAVGMVGCAPNGHWPP
jgi:hypothetical protein